MQQRAVFRNCTSVCDVERAIAMDIFFDSILIVMELIGLFTIADVYFERKFDGRKPMILVIAMYVFCFELLGKFLNLIGTALIKSVIVIISFYVLIRLCYEGKRLKQLILTGIFSVFLYAVDYFVMTGCLQLLHMNMNMLYHSEYVFTVTLLSSKSILLYSCVAFAKRMENRRRDEKFLVLEWGQLLIVPICMILNLMIVVFVFNQIDDFTFILFFDILLLIFGTFIYVYLERELEKKKQMEIQNLIFAQQIQSEEKQMELIRNHLQEQRKLTHDFRNHLYTLQELLQNPKHTEEALVYIEQLTENSEVKTQIIHTTNPIIDALLNQKYTVCKKEQIPIFFELNDLHTFEIEQEKVVVILSNILDNAIESCRKQGSERFIKVKFLTGDSRTILSVQNTANIKNVNHFNGVTTKANPLLHGYGLKNALQAVEDSGGVGEISCEDEMFQFTALWN